MRKEKGDFSYYISPFSFLISHLFIIGVRVEVNLLGFLQE